MHGKRLEQEAWGPRESLGSDVSLSSGAADLRRRAFHPSSRQREEHHMHSLEARGSVLCAAWVQLEDKLE